MDSLPQVNFDENKHQIIVHDKTLASYPQFKTKLPSAINKIIIQKQENKGAYSGG